MRPHTADTGKSRNRAVVAVNSSHAAEDEAALRQKLQLLERDRKSFYETSQIELKRNRAEILRLRTENSELKATITAAQRNGVSVTEKEASQLDKAISTLTLKLDRARADVARNATELQSLRQKKETFTREAEPVLRDDSYMTQRIRLLENRLDKSLIKHNEAVAIQKTYQQILRRLQEERVGFDNQLAAIERTLSAKDSDYQELLKMSHEANHAKELARKELQDMKTSFDEERRAKDRELAERKLFVQSRVDQTQKLEKKEKQLRQKEADDQRAKQDNEDALMHRSRTNGGLLTQRSATDALSAEDEERLMQYEAAYKKIKEATGIADVGEMLHKYVTQEETHRNLELMIRDAQSRMDQLQTEKAELTAKLEELRYSGSGQLGSRRIVEEFEVHLGDVQRQREANGVRYEELVQTLISLRAGVEHLVEKLAIYRPELSSPPVTDETIVEVLRLVEEKLAALAEDVIPADGSEDALLTTAFELPQHNRRVRVSTANDEDEADDGANEGDDQDDDAVLKRDQVKKISANSVQRETKKLRRKKPTTK